MGSGLIKSFRKSSNSEDKKDKYVREPTILKIEQFVKSVYLASSKADGLKLIIKTKFGLSNFQKFLANNSPNLCINLKAILDAEKILCEVSESFLETALKYLIEYFFTSHDGSELTIFSDPVYSKVRAIAKILDKNNQFNIELKGDAEETSNLELYQSYVKDIKENLNATHSNFSSLLFKIKEEILTNLSKLIFMKFINSNYYLSWRKGENSHASALSYEDAQLIQTSKSLPILNIAKDAFSSGNLSQIKTLCLENYNFEERTNEIDQAILNTDELSLSEIFKNGDWMPSFLSAVECLPLSIIVSSALQTRLGFPIIYSNHHFFKVSGYEQDEVLGLNCRFLQYEGTEAESIKKLSDALKRGLPVTTVINNKRKDGNVFRNLVSLKPIFDTKRNYRFVIAVQLNVTNRGQIVDNEINFLSTLLGLLPDNVYIEN